VAGRPIKAVPRTPSAAERIAELEVELALAEEALKAEKARAAALETTLAESQAEAQAREETQTSALAAANARISELEDALAQHPSEASPSPADLAERLEDAVARLQEHLTLNHRLMHDMQQLQAREQELQRRLYELQSERDDVRKQLSFALEAQVMRENSVLELHRALASFLGKRAFEAPPLIERNSTVVEKKDIRKTRSPKRQASA
jgi:chromosome segregation ATPase